MNVLVIPDPDEWVQMGRPLYVIEVTREDDIEYFSKLVLHADGSVVREWLRARGVRLIDGVPLSKIDYVVSLW